MLFRSEYFYFIKQGAIWRYHLTSYSLTKLLDHPNIIDFYLAKNDEIWLADNEHISTFAINSQNLAIKFPFKFVRNLIGDGINPPFIVTREGIYSNKGDATFEYLTANQRLGKINQSIYLNGYFYIASDTGFWQVQQQLQQWQFKHLLQAQVTNISASKNQLIWLQAGNQTLLYHLGFYQLVSRFNSRLLAPLSTNFSYLDHHYFLNIGNESSANRVMRYILQSEVSLNKPQGLSISAIQIDNKTVNFTLSHIELFNQNNTVHFNFVDNEINTEQLALAYRFSDDTLWHSLPKGQAQVTLVNIPKSAQKIEFYNQTGLIQKPVQVSISHSYRVLNPWLMSTAILLLCALLLIIFSYIKRKKEAQYGLTSALLAQTQEAIWISDEHFKVQQINQAFQTITGYSILEVTNKQLKVFDGNTRNTKLEHIIIAAIKDTGFWSGEIWSQRKNGQPFAISINITKIQLPTLLSFNTSTHFVGMFKDITQLKQQEKQLRELATRDQVTDLVNRTLFIEQINLAIHACASNQPEFCILFINLDNFYKINDGLGHSCGNRVLKLIAQRIEQTISPSYTLACLGGDEFGILIPPHLFKPLNIFNIKKLCEKLLNELSRTLTLDDIELCLSASIGTAVYPDNGYDCESILRSADSALQHAKACGKNTFQIFNRTIKTLTPESLTLENEINRAINNKEFILYYQPKFNTHTNQIVGVEALARWPDGNHEIRSPAQFISVAESNNAIVPLTRVLIEVCCKQIKQWQLQGLVLNGRVALNLSAIHFQRSDLIDDLTTYLNKYQISGDTMELEITESVMMNDPEFALKQMNKLKRLGFTIALDDFGTGHSSLSYLKTFPIDRLKIDRSFVIDIKNSEQDRNITATIIRLAKYLNIEVVAEGVESEEQSYFLHIMGCNVIQGYFFSKPLPCKQLEELVHETQLLVNKPAE